MKLIRSMPGVPSATPAQENRAWTGPPHSSTAASIDALSDRSRPMALTPSRVTSARSMTTTSAPASFTSSAVAAPMPVAPPTTRARLPSYLNASNRPISLLSSRMNRQRLPAPHRRCAGHRGVLPVDGPLGEASEHLVERHPSFEAGEGGAEAEVDAVPEAQVVTDLAVDVEAVTVGEPALVAVCAPVQQHHHAALGHGLAVVLDVPSHVPGLHRRRGLVPEQLL